MDPISAASLPHTNPKMDAQIEQLRMMPLRQKTGMTEEQMREAADQFETMITRLLLKEMRKTVPSEDGLFSQTQSTKMYNDIVDDHLAEELAKNNSLGIDTLIYEELKGMQVNKDEPDTGENGFMELSQNQNEFIPIQSTEEFLKLRQDPRYYELNQNSDPFMPLEGHLRVSSSEISNL